MPKTSLLHDPHRLERYRDALYRSALQLTSSPQDADDLVHRTFARALEKSGQWARVERPLGWLQRIQRNLFLDDARRAVRRRRVLDEQRQMSVIGTTEHRPHRAQLRLELAQVLRELPAPMGQALLLVLVEGHTYAEVAEIQGVAPGTVKSRVSRARAALAARLAPEGDV